MARMRKATGMSMLRERVPDGLLGLFERTAWPMAALGSAVRPASEAVRVDVGARMRGHVAIRRSGLCAISIR
jgi:hypothetical protein